MSRARLSMLLVALVAAGCSKGEPAKSTAGSGSAPGSAATTAGSTTPPPPPPAIDAAAPPPPPPVDAAGVSAAPADDAGAARPGDGVAFDDLSDDDKAKFMRAKVVPAMKAAFQKFDPKEFGKFNCKTCHGKGAITKEYDMPNPDLPALDFAELKAGKHGAVARFMKDVVTPGMADLLGQPERSPTNPDGFGCLECHVEKK